MKESSPEMKIQELRWKKSVEILKNGGKTAPTTAGIANMFSGRGDVKKALELHNKEVRANITREDILENTGRDVKLKPIKLLSDLQLTWRIVETA